ncbi:MAG: transposase [bacterium]
MFTRQIYRDIVVDSLKFCKENKGLDIFAFVIMSNHIHLLAKSYNGELSNTIRDLKQAANTARRMKS